MPLSPETTEIAALAGAGLGALGLGLGAVASIQLARMRKAYRTLQGAGKREDFVGAVNRHLAEVDGLRGEVASLSQAVARIDAAVADAIRHVAVVRFDAFPDMGGRLSFSAALLDDAGDGLVITSINGRSETRTYAKGVKARTGEHQLSPEEEQAIAFAARSAARA